MTSRPLIVGHRGASAAASENTLDAYRLALTLGGAGFELDVRRSADGDLVLHHDPSLSDGRAIYATPTAELPDTVPTLAQALDVANGAFVNVEIKNIPGEPGFAADLAIADDVCALLAARTTADDVLISCFHLATLDRCKALAPDVPTGFLTFVEPSAGDSVDLAARHGHDAINPHYAFVDRELVTRAHDAGLRVNVWTVNDADILRNLADLGVDAVITDVPDLALAVYAERG